MILYTRILCCLACVSALACVRRETEWFVADGRVATEKAFPSIPLGKDLSEVLAHLSAEPSFCKPLKYPSRPRELLARLAKRARGYWPRRKDVREQMHWRLGKDAAIPEAEWRHFAFSRGWLFLERDLYDSVPLDGSYEVCLIRIARVYRSMYGFAEDIYTGLLVSPDGVVVGKKYMITYARERRVQKAILAEDVFLP